jgi:hypothetical protein
VLDSIDDDVISLLKSNPSLFTFKKCKDGVVEVRDFQTTGVVAFARGAPFYCMPTGKLDIGGHRVGVKRLHRIHRWACSNALAEPVPAVLGSDGW